MAEISETLTGEPVLPGKQSLLHTAVVPQTPFENIALAISGGGFRAAGYGLGVLSYLNHLRFLDHQNSQAPTPLLHKVKFISSASGGSMCNALYTLHTAQNGNDSFDVFYKKLLNFMQGDTALKRALEILNDDKIWSKHKDGKSRTLINAFAIAYDEDTLFNGATIQDLRKTETHLEEVWFNSTELYKGVTFRQGLWLKGGNTSRVLFGNYYIRLKAAVAQQLKIADVFAASSCFPAGFEPIIFPNDFAHGDFKIAHLKAGLTMLAKSDEEKEFAQQKTFALMDGGITDNLGVDTLMLSDQRRMKATSAFKRFDLILSSDVGSHYMTPYREPEPVTRADVFSVAINKAVMWVGIIAGLCWGAALVGITYIYTSNATSCPKAGLIFYTAVFSITTVILALVVYLSDKLTLAGRKQLLMKIVRRLNLGKNFTPAILELVTRFLSGLNLSVSLQLVQERISSVITLNTDVFLTRIRRLIFNRLYEMPAWQYRRQGNFIYDLSKTNQTALASQIKKFTPVEQALLTPTVAVMQIADNAFDMPTTLWFDTEQVQQGRLKDIVACGQFTTCYNLLEYILEFKRTGAYAQLPEGSYKARVDELEEKLRQDWVDFKSNPHFLFEKMQEN